MKLQAYIFLKMELNTLIKMKLKKLYDSEGNVMNVAGFMSGSGSNLVEIIKHSEKLGFSVGSSPYEGVVIFSDNVNSNAVSINAPTEI